MKKRTWPLGCVLMLLFCAVLSGASEVKTGKFQKTYLHFVGKRQNHAIYDFNGDGRLDILVSSIHFDDDPPTRWFSLFLQNNEGRYPAEADQVWPVSSKACAFMFGRFTADPQGKATQIAFVAPDGVYAYAQKDGRIDEKPAKLIHSETFFTESSEIAVPVLQQQDDLDGNGLDDLVLPLRHGYKVFMQTAPGVFSKITRIPLDIDHYPFIHNRKSASFVVYRELPKLETADVNGDGRKDLVMIRGNVMATYFQNKQGGFETKPKQCAIRILTESHDKNKIDVSFIAITDLNGDRVADLVITKIQGTLGFFDSIKSFVYIYFGNGRGIFINPDRALMITGVTIPPDLIDINQDSFKDIVTTSVPANLMNQIINFILQDVEITFMISTYKKELRNYDGSPDFTRRASTPIKDVEKSMLGGVPLLYFRGDHSGDGRIDMIMLQTDKTLEIRLGIPQSSDFEKNEFFKTALERYPKGLEVRDLNMDKRDDIILMHNGALGLLISEK